MSGSGNSGREPAAPGAPALSAAEIRVAEALLSQVWGERAVIVTAEAIWGRGHVVRLLLNAGRTAIVKRRDDGCDHSKSRSFGAELATLEFLNAMPVPVAPRLLGADPTAGLLVMEELGQGASLADSLMRTDRERAEAGLIAYARALAALHAWSMGRRGELDALRSRYDAGPARRTELMGFVERGRRPFFAMAAAAGVSVRGAKDEAAGLGAMLDELGPQGLVHGDACPDNLRIARGACRIFDFENSGWGPVALDVVYLLAPFPSCWCFASLPADAAAPAVAAYAAGAESAGILLGPDWDAALAVALACWIVARGRGFRGILDEDPEWGTTTMRPRLVGWLRSFLGVAAAAGVLPRLRELAEALLGRLAERWPDLVVPGYPAFAPPGAVLARVPEGWQPGD